MLCRRRRRKRQEEHRAEPVPVSFPVFDIRVSDDGFPLTGRRYSGYLAEVLRRQEEGVAQDVVMVAYRQATLALNHAQGTPKVNTADELEVYTLNLLLGTVRDVGGELRFFPA